VTFDIDANGILKVTAQDKATSRSQHITITASSGLRDDEVEQMRKDAEAHAEEDKKRKELIEARNLADNAVYTAEKTLKDLGDKIPGELKEKVETEVAKVRAVLTSENAGEIRNATDALMSVVQELGAAAYQQAGPATGQPGEAGSEGEAGAESEDNGEDVVDGEFTEEETQE
jgi:molecular chaperone DnaK